MKRFVIILLAILMASPVFAQVGRYKNIKVMYPGYSLKLDTATGELTAVHFDNDTETLSEEVISPKKSHNSRHIGRYEFRRTRHIGVYQIFDTSSGNYTTVKWKPRDSNGKEIEADIKQFLNKLEEGLDNIQKDTCQVTV